MYNDDGCGGRGDDVDDDSDGNIAIIVVDEDVVVLSCCKNYNSFLKQRKMIKSIPQ